MSNTSQSRKKAFAEHGEECQTCGGTGELEVHHIDGDPTNNQTDNLLPVCRGCHGDIHAGKLEEWAEKILPRSERNRRVSYLMGPQTQRNIELIMFTADLNSEKEAIRHVVREYNDIYDIIQESKSELPSELIKERHNATLKLSESVDAVLQQHIESSELVEEIRRDMAEVVADHLFKSKIPVPEDEAGDQ